MELIGRPSSYTAEIGQAICERISAGESLRQVCRDDSMPYTSVVMRWAKDIPAFQEQYRAAREMLLEHWAEETVEISDDGTNDWIERELKGGRIERVVDSEHVRRSQLRVHTRMWMLSRLAPKKYGDRIQQEVTGKDGGPIETKDSSEVGRKIAFLLAKGLQGTTKV